MKNTNRIVANSIMMIVSFLLLFTGSTSVAKTIKLRYSTAYPDFHILEKNVYQPLWAAIEEATNRRVIVEPYYNAVLTSMGEMYSSVLTGRADISNNYCASAAGVFPISEVLGFAPFDALTGKQSTIFWELYEKFPALQKEYARVKVLTTPATVMQMFGQRKEPAITKLEQLKGYKLSTAGGWMSKRAENLGVSSVNVPIVDLYDALSKGVTDGVVFGWTDYNAFRLNEVAPIFTIVNFGYVPYFFIMSKKKWDSIGSEDQQAIDKLCGSQLAGQIDEVLWNHWVTEKAKAEKKGELKFYKVATEDIAKWNDHDRKVRKMWVNAMKENGVNGQEILDYFDQLLMKYSAK